MSIILRVLLLVASVCTAYMIIHKIRKCKVKQADSLFWVVFAMILAILGIFPQLSYWMSTALGIISPANFIFLVIIALLLEKLLSVSIQVSMLESKVEIMSAELAIRCKDLEDKSGKSDEEK